jgi:hypothetical protein
MFSPLFTAGKPNSIGISDFNSISAQNHTPVAISRQPQIAEAAVAGQAWLLLAISADALVMMSRLRLVKEVADLDPWNSVGPAITPSEGVTAAERCIGKPCKRSFLSMWSYLGVFRDQKAAAGGRRDVKNSVTFSLFLKTTASFLLTRIVSSTMRTICK